MVCSFDLIFIVRDVRDEARDQRIAAHVIQLHMHSATAAPENEIPIRDPKRFISYLPLSAVPALRQYYRSTALLSRC